MLATSPATDQTRLNNVPSEQPPPGQRLPPAKSLLHADGLKRPYERTSVDSTDLETLHAVLDVFEHFRDLEFIQRLVKQYCENAEAAMVPKPIMRIFAASLTPLNTFLDQERSKHEVLGLAENFIHRAMTEVVLNSDSSSADFIACFTGDNLRLETLGIVLNVAARSCCLGLVPTDRVDQDRIQSLYKASSSCLQIARDTATELNDVILWLAFEDVRLTTHILGDSRKLEIWPNFGLEVFLTILSKCNRQ